MKLSAGGFQQLRFTGLLVLLAIIMAGGAVYWNSFQQQRLYLTSRDFRLLTVLGTQVEALMDGNARMFEGAQKDASTTRTPVSQWFQKAGPFVRILQDVTVRPDVKGIASGGTSRRFLIDPDGPRSRLRLDVAPAADAPGFEVSVGLATLLEPTFTSKLEQGVFDTLALATPDGRVVFATGRRQQELQSAPLDTVLAATMSDGGKTFQRLARTISVGDAMVAGVAYKLFIQPCCGAVTIPLAKAGGPAPSGLIVAGLIEADKLHSGALAISPALVIVGVLSTLLALVVWPFLKFTFMGERQRVTVWDVVQLGACSIFGLALGAIIIITADLYSRLDADVDEQLEGLAQQLRDNLGSEINLAYRQLSDLEHRFENCADGAFENIVSAASTGGGACPRPLTELDGPQNSASYPDYEAFALINAEGLQVVKTAPRRFVPSRIPVRGRAYFEAVRPDTHWRDLPRCRLTPDGAPTTCFVDSVWSWTNGEPQAVLATPTGIATLPVATLAFPMRSLIDPVLPPGFEYAIVDGAGTVLFHSDQQRNVQEKLLIETDENRRLRALISGHNSGAFDTMYWGRSYRAYVEPARFLDWTIVTLSDQQATRGLVLEWTAVSLLLLSVYLVVWVATIIVAMSVGTAWMWPDARRRSSYLLLAGAYAVLFAMFAVVAFSGDSKRLLTTAVYIAVAAWAIALVALFNRPVAPTTVVTANEAMSAKVHRGHRSRRAAWEYALAGALFLVVSGIVPGVAFVVRAYDMHIESYVKHRQLGIARAVAARAQRTGAQEASINGGQLDRAYAFFYNTSVTAADEPTAPSSTATEQEPAHHDLLQTMLEEYLPYYSDASVEMRELLHDHAEDDTWSSKRTADGLELRVAQDTPGAALVVRSSLPAPVPFWSSRAHTPGGAHSERPLIMPYLAPLLLLALGWFAYRMVTFSLHHVYLSSVYEPLWPSERLVAAGDNMLALCDDRSVLASKLQDMSTLQLGPIVKARNPADAWASALRRITSRGPGRPVVITDVDTELDDPDLTQRKLGLLEELVDNPERTVVVLLQVPREDAAQLGLQAPGGPLWTRLLQAFVVLDWRKPSEDDHRETRTDWRSIFPFSPRWRRRTANWRAKSEVRRWIRDAVHSGASGRHDILAEEGRTDGFVWAICEDIRHSEAFLSGSVSTAQVLDEIDDRASTYYQRVWDDCSNDEKVVLGHVAQYGLTTAASRRIVRGLLVRRLLTKDPDLRLMNETFRHFVLSAPARAEVAQLEGVAEPSTWDRLRLPFALAAVSAGAFLFTTQRDMFNETVTVMTAMATAVPTVFRAVAVVVKREPGGAVPSSNA